MSWREQAACLNADPDIFFPEKGHPAAPAQRICARCPVTEQCLNEALILGSPVDGVWGGMSARQITRLHASQAKKGPEHGTRWCYGQGCRCDRCVNANRSYLRQWRAQSA